MPLELVGSDGDVVELLEVLPLVLEDPVTEPTDELKGVLLVLIMEEVVLLEVVVLLGDVVPSEELVEGGAAAIVI